MVRISALTAAAVLSFCSSGVLAAPSASNPLALDPKDIQYWPEESEWVKDPNYKAPDFFVQDVRAGPEEVQLAAPASNFNGTQIPGFIPPSAKEGAEAARRALDDHLQKRDVIGAESRFYYPNRNYPFSAMGRILATRPGHNDRRCSASVVGPRHVLTARHCLGDAIGETTYHYQPGYDQGTKMSGTWARSIVYPPRESGWCDWATDYVIMITNDRVGEWHGWLGLTYPTTADWHAHRFANFGYPSDLGSAERPFLQGGVKIHAGNDCYLGAPTFSDADADNGQSGGPIFEMQSSGTYVYSVLVGKHPDYTVASGGTRLLNTLFDTLRDFP